MKKINKQAQVWTFDFILGLLIFVFGILMAIYILVSQTNDVRYKTLYEDINHLSLNLVSPGYPSNWNETNVIIPGLIELNKINTVDINKLYEFDKLNYAQTKTLNHISNEYVFYFKNSTQTINISLCVRGYAATLDQNCEPNTSSIKYNNLVRVERIVVLNKTVVSMIIYGWN
jgi:hypothetical protein